MLGIVTNKKNLCPPVAFILVREKENAFLNYMKLIILDTDKYYEEKWRRLKGYKVEDRMEGELRNKELKKVSPTRWYLSKGLSDMKETSMQTVGGRIV